MTWRGGHGLRQAGAQLEMRPRSSFVQVKVHLFHLAAHAHAAHLNVSLRQGLHSYRRCVHLFASLDDDTERSSAPAYICSLGQQCGETGGTRKGNIVAQSVHRNDVILHKEQAECLRFVCELEAFQNTAMRQSHLVGQSSHAVPVKRYKVACQLAVSGLIGLVKKLHQKMENSSTNRHEGAVRTDSTTSPGRSGQSAT